MNNMGNIVKNNEGNNINDNENTISNNNESNNINDNENTISNNNESNNINDNKNTISNNNESNNINDSENTISNNNESENVNVNIDNSQNNSKKISNIVSILVILIAIGVLIYILYFKSSNEKRNIPSNNNISDIEDNSEIENDNNNEINEEDNVDSNNKPNIDTCDLPDPDYIDEDEDEINEEDYKVTEDFLKNCSYKVYKISDNEYIKATYNTAPEILEELKEGKKINLYSLGDTYKVEFKNGTIYINNEEKLNNVKKLVYWHNDAESDCFSLFAFKNDGIYIYDSLGYEEDDDEDYEEDDDEDSDNYEDKINKELFVKITNETSYVNIAANEHISTGGVSGIYYYVTQDNEYIGIGSNKKLDLDKKSIYSNSFDDVEIDENGYLFIYGDNKNIKVNIIFEGFDDGFIFIITDDMKLYELNDVNNYVLNTNDKKIKNIYYKLDEEDCLDYYLIVFEDNTYKIIEVFYYLIDLKSNDEDD